MLLRNEKMQERQRAENFVVFFQIQVELNGLSNGSIPLAELLLSAGFFIIYLTEELMAFFMPEPCRQMSHIQAIALESSDENIKAEDENENQDKSPVTKEKRFTEASPPEGVDTVDQNSSSRFNEISLDAITSSKIISLE